MDSQDKEDLIWISKFLLFSIPIIFLFMFNSEIIRFMRFIVAAQFVSFIEVKKISSFLRIYLAFLFWSWIFYCILSYFIIRKSLFITYLLSSTFHSDNFGLNIKFTENFTEMILFILLLIFCILFELIRYIKKTKTKKNN